MIDGLRIDHIDGLLDPAGYLDRLRLGALPASVPIFVEKILASGEHLPPRLAGAGHHGLRVPE